MVQVSEVEKAVAKATDAKLTRDNWQYILDVCDMVKEDPEDAGDEAMKVIEQNLSQQNDANVILRTLSLSVSLAENCGSRLKQQVCSKSFTNLLYSLLENKSIHALLKKEVAKMVKQLSASCHDDPSLRYMEDLLHKIQAKWPQLLSQDDPNLPSKAQLSLELKRSEEKDLEEALRLSLLDSAPPQPQPEVQAPPVQEPSVTIRKVRALYDLAANEPGELSFQKGDVITVLEQVYRDWWKGALRGNIGIFPTNYVAPIAEPSTEELIKETQDEVAVFNQKQNIDKLHQLLSESSSSGQQIDLRQDAEINDIYASVTPLRPQITKMIGKCSQEKDELLSLRQILVNAEQTYNQLLDRAASTYTSPPAIPNQYPAAARQQQQPYPQYSMVAPQQRYPPNDYHHVSYQQSNHMAPSQYNNQPNL